MMSIYKKILNFFFCIILILYINTSTAQTNFLKNFITINEGLTQNSVDHFYQDKKGYLWLVTWDGINRYDGNKVATYNNTAGNNSIFVTSRNLTETMNGDIWYTTRNGITKLSPPTGNISSIYNTSWLHEKHFNDNPKQMRCFIKADSSDKIWIFKCMNHFGCLDLKKKKFTKFDVSEQKDCASVDYIYMDDNNNIWQTSKGKKGIYYINLSSINTKLFLPHLNITSCFEQNKSIWILSDNKLIRFNTLDFSFKTYQLNIDKNHQEIAFVDTVKQEIWLRGNLGKEIVAYSYGITNYKNKPKIKYTCTTGIYNTYIDRSQNLWIGTVGEGGVALNLKNSIFNLYPHTEENNLNNRNFFIKSIFAESEDSVWLGTFQSGLYLFSPAKNNVINSYYANTNTRNNNIGETIHAIYKDKEGYLLIGHEFGLSYFDKKLNKIIPVYTPYFHENKFQVFIIHEYKSSILLGTSNGLYQYKHGRVPEKIQLPIIDDARISALFTDNEKNLWIGYTNGYALIAKFDDSLKRKSNNIILPNAGGIRCFYQPDKENKIYIGTKKGIFITTINGHTLQTINTDNGLKNNSIYSIINDNYNRLWFSTNSGITSYNTITKKIINYNSSDGLQSNEFNTNAYHKSKKGILYFGGINGLNWFNPNDIQINYQEPNVAIQKIIVNGLPTIYDIKNNQKITLNHNQNTLEISISILELTNPSKNSYKYILKGIDNDWVAGNKSYEIRYANLKPGSYELNIVGCNNDGICIKVPFKISVQINPPYWKTWWFLLLCSFVILLMIYVVISSQLKSIYRKKFFDIEKQNMLFRERYRIARDMHDDVGTGLTHILMMTNLQKIKTPSTENMLETINKINIESKELISSVNDSVWMLKLNDLELESFINWALKRLYSMFEYTDIKFKSHLQLASPKIILNNFEARNIYLILKEILNNAVKHSHAHNLILSIKVDDGNKLTCVTVDDGVGINLENTNLGNGISNIKKRVEELNGEIIFRNNIPHGTKISFTIMLGDKS